MIVGHESAVMNDVISTGHGNDTIKLWGGGVDGAHGGEGTDKLIYIPNADNFGFYLTNLASDASGYTGNFFRNLNSSTMGVGFSGIDKFVFIYNGSGNNTINTGNGGDDLRGGSGNDTFNSGSGRDKLLGGGGNDNLNGAGGNDAINGGGGNDTVTGGNGNDRILGAFGNDMMSGDAGADTILGGGGNDTINGGGGNDRLTGNKGFDTFVFDKGFGHDTVFGFAPSNHEKIDLSGVTAITGFIDLVNHHLTTDPGTNFAEIVAGTNTILLNGVDQTDIGAGQIYSAADFIF